MVFFLLFFLLGLGLGLGLGRQPTPLARIAILAAIWALEQLTAAARSRTMHLITGVLTKKKKKKRRIAFLRLRSGFGEESQMIPARKSHHKNSGLICVPHKWLVQRGANSALCLLALLIRS